MAQDPVAVDPKVADELMPDSEVIQKNLVLTRLLMTGRSR